jgi:chromosome segregation ATPase
VNAAKKALTRQLERIPMDRELRAEVSAGIGRLNDALAAEQAERLQSALDDIPELLTRLERARNPTESSLASAQHPPLEPLIHEAAGGALALDEKDEEIARLHHVIYQRDEQIQELEAHTQELAQERDRLRSDFSRLRQEAQEKIDKVMERFKELNQQLMDRGDAGGVQKTGTYR